MVEEKQVFCVPWQPGVLFSEIEGSQNLQTVVEFKQILICSQDPASLTNVCTVYNPYWISFRATSSRLKNSTLDESQTNVLFLCKINGTRLKLAESWGLTPPTFRLNRPAIAAGSTRPDKRRPPQHTDNLVPQPNSYGIVRSHGKVTGARTFGMRHPLLPILPPVAVMLRVRNGRTPKRSYP